MSKTAREVISYSLARRLPGPKSVHDELSDSIISDLKAAGFDIWDAEKFAKALKKGREITDRVERQASLIELKKLARLEALEEAGFDFSSAADGE